MDLDYEYRFGKIILSDYKTMNFNLERSIASTYVELGQLEDTLSDILQGNGNETRQINNIHIAINAIEKLGCNTNYFYEFIEKEETYSKNIEVLFLDLDWISPGPVGKWSEKGQQACYCITNKTTSTLKVNWYKAVLKKYFNAQNQRSLLSYRDIFTRPEFFTIHYLDNNGHQNKLNSTEEILVSETNNEAWLDSFTPDPLSVQSTEEWTERFDLYVSLIQQGLNKEFGEKSIGNARLVWVYVSSGADKIGDDTPLWAASMFILYRLNPNKSNNNPYESLFVSNLLRSLKGAAYKTLGRSYVNRYFAQALSHEYKNLNQDVAILSEQMMDCFKDIPPSKRDNQFADFYDRVQALHFAAQATTAISKATYWLAVPSLKGIYFCENRASEIFQHVLYLAINLISITRNNWKLIDIPTLDETLTLLSHDLGLNKNSLLSNLCISIMLFFALEPVRNIRNNYPLSVIEVSVDLDLKENILKLHQNLSVKEIDSPIMRSASIEALMQTLNDSNYKLRPFIYINPNVESKVEKQSEKYFIVKRTTTIKVYQIPRPKNK